MAKISNPWRSRRTWGIAAWFFRFFKTVLPGREFITFWSLFLWLHWFSSASFGFSNYEQIRPCRKHQIYEYFISETMSAHNITWSRWAGKLHQISRTILTAHNPTWWRRMMDGRVGQTLCQVIRRDHFEVTSVVCYWIFHVDNAYIPPFPPFLWTDFFVSLQTVLSNLWFCKWLRALYLGPLWKHPGCLP